MSAESILPDFPENNISGNEQREKDGLSVDNATIMENGSLGRILPTKISEILPLALCESPELLPVEENSVLKNNTSSEIKPSSKKWYLQVGLCGEFAINNYLYEKRKTCRNSKGETVLYLECTKSRTLNCKNGRAVLVIDEKGTKRIRRCCEDEDHTHPPPFAEVVKRNVKFKLKALTERFPEKTMPELYETVVKEETLAYAEIDPDFSKYIPDYRMVKSFIHRERQRVRQGRGLYCPRLPKRSKTEYETVEINGLKRSSKYLTSVSSSNKNTLEGKEIKTEIISSSDTENSCAGDPIESEALATFSEGASTRDDSSDVANSSTTNNNESFIPFLQYPQQNNVRFENQSTSTGVHSLQANNPSTFERSSSLPSTMARSDPNSTSGTGEIQPFCDQLNFQSRFDLLAKNWSEKLKTLRNDQRIFAEKLINDVLYEAEWNLLNHGCHISSRFQMNLRTQFNSNMNDSHL